MKKQNAFPKENEYDPKENFLKITNDFQDALCKIRIAGEARQILDAIERRTFGWGIKWAEISYIEFRQMTGLNNWSISRAIEYLLSMRIIVCCNNATTGKVNYRIETDSTQWRAVAIMQHNRGNEKKDEKPAISRRINATKSCRNNATNSRNNATIIRPVLNTSLKTEYKDREDDIIFEMSKSELQQRKTELIEDRKEQIALHQNVQYYDDAINKISQRLKQLSQSSNPSSHKISRSERKKIISKKETRS